MNDAHMEWAIVEGELRHVSDFAELQPKERPELDNQKWWAFDTTSRTDSTVGNNLTVR